MLKEYKFTAEQINEIGKMLSDAPAKYVLPVVDYLRQIMDKQNEQEKAVQAGNEMSQ